ncbi:MAG: TetR/AcrR family transcriptional regulator [Anaerolineae bacterium]|nr:TetR/AcrR family transcriptional regulator [Anaerolineae bacterium]
MSSSEPETRERILKETWHLMEKSQGQGVRLQDIAKAAGVSRQAVYMHFGSRAGLLIATTHYLDKMLKLEDRLQPYRNAQTAIEALDAFIEFWINYIPDIYGLAKALLAARETDADAAAAWEDRMQAVRSGCHRVAVRLHEEGLLAAGWSIDEATDFFWALLSVRNWENLTLACGWTNAQFIGRTKQVLRAILVRGIAGG